MLRYYWYEDNDPSKTIIAYRARVHVFGNSCSPAISTMCMRKAVEMYDSVRENQNEISDKVKSFINKDFYVDDGLSSANSVEDAVNTLRC